MIGIYSILLGAAIVVGALFLLRREFKQAYFIGPREKTASMSVSDRADTTLEALDEMESAFTQMSEAFYDITGDLEGKFSVHEKELVLYLERIEALEKKVQDQKMLIEKQETALGQLDQRLQIKPSIEEKVGQPRGYMNKGMDNKESEDNIEMRETAFDLENRITHSNHEAVLTAISQQLRLIPRNVLLPYVAKGTR